jgi:serine/threonine protein kinase
MDVEGGSAVPAGLGPGQRDVVAGRYLLKSLIAEGGMGSVYRAEHLVSRARLALKVVHPHLTKGRQGVERFRREVSAAAEIGHPGIVQVFDAGVDDDGGFFMAMELLDGESLGDRLRRSWPGMATSVRLVEGMLEPLAAAHERGYVHRDLKPDNIFVAEQDGVERVKLLDFGLAREMKKGGPTRTGITFGTPEYMSPEQAMSARKVKAPGDVWSVAVMLYELLSGRHPFEGETATAIMANAIKEPHVPLCEAAARVPAALSRFVDGCLAKDPIERPADAGVMLQELRQVLLSVTLDESTPEEIARPSLEVVSSGGDHPVVDEDLLARLPSPRPAERETISDRPGAPAARRRLGWGTALLLGFAALGLAGALAGALLTWSRPPLAEAPTEEAPSPPPPAPLEAPAPRPEPAPPLAQAPPPPPPPPASSGAEATPASPAEAPARSRSSLARAQACGEDARCIVDALGRRPSGARELETLFEAYRSLGQEQRAAEVAARYVERYGSRPRARFFRRYALAQGLDVE